MLVDDDEMPQPEPTKQLEDPRQRLVLKNTTKTLKESNANVFGVYDVAWLLCVSGASVENTSTCQLFVVEPFLDSRPTPTPRNFDHTHHKHGILRDAAEVSEYNADHVSCPAGLTHLGDDIRRRVHVRLQVDVTLHLMQRDVHVLQRKENKARFFSPGPGYWFRISLDSTERCGSVRHCAVTGQSTKGKHQMIHGDERRDCHRNLQVRDPVRKGSSTTHLDRREARVDVSEVPERQRALRAHRVRVAVHERLSNNENKAWFTLQASCASFLGCNAEIISLQAHNARRIRRKSNAEPKKVFCVTNTGRIQRESCLNTSLITRRY